jgi:hypothetical protein
MYLTRLEVEGFRGAEHRVIEVSDGGRGAALPEGPARCAVADAIDLLAAGLDQLRMLGVARRLGWASPGTEVAGEPGDAELQGLHAPSVAAVLARDVRAVTIDATLALDPPLYGRLREHAARDPRMVTALGHEPSVRVKVGWLVSRDRSSLNPAVLMVRVGDVGFETQGKDRPAWLPELLVELGGRFGRVDGAIDADTLAERLLAAQTSPDPERRAAAVRLADALVATPFSLPRPEVVRAGARVELAFGPELLRARQLGRDAVDAVRLAEAAFLARPDVLVVSDTVPVGEGEGAVKRWLAALPERDEAPVEQVWS